MADPPSVHLKVYARGVSPGLPSACSAIAGFPQVSVGPAGRGGRGRGGCRTAGGPGPRLSGGAASLGELAAAPGAGCSSSSRR